MVVFPCIEKFVSLCSKGGLTVKGTHSINMGNDANVPYALNVRFMVRSLSCRMSPSQPSSFQIPILRTSDFACSDSTWPNQEDVGLHTAAAEETRW